MNGNKLLQQMFSLALVTLLLVGCGGGSHATPTPTTGKVEGTVLLDGDTGQPIADVDVDLLSESSLDTIASIKTDSRGHYSFVDVEPGRYTVTAYVKGNCMSMALNDPVLVTAGQTTKKDISLPCTP